jgi:hypothetical protein
MSIRIFLGVKGQLGSKADNLTFVCEPIVYKLSEPLHLTTLWASMALPLAFLFIQAICLISLVLVII